ncbi:MAG: peptidase M64 N-terminal domain-containing protein, partial [Bacteroidales bacterium]|nr:peptidase M64 N-terminal domain-containing protein [Bacteroidales bacterium]
MKKNLFFVCCLGLILAAFNSENEDKNQETKASVEKTFSQSKNSGNVQFDKYFEPKTMRFDYYHNGTDSEEHFAPDKFLSDGAWAGSLTSLIDE